MKAIQLTTANELALADIPKPAVKPGYVLVEVKASAIQPSDRLNAKGGFSKTQFPIVPGRDFSGVIVEGPQSRIGEEVYGSGGSHLGFSDNGTHAEFCLMPEHLAVKKPKGLSFIQAASLGVPHSTAMLCLVRARVKPTDTVLVLGAEGNVGSAARQIAGLMGCKQVLGASRSGKSEVNSKEDPKLEAVAKLTDGKGVDVVVDTVGNLELMSASIDVLAPRGRYAFIAAPRGKDANTVLQYDILKAYRNEVELVGCDSTRMLPEELEPALQKVTEWFDTGKLSTKADDGFEIVSLDTIAATYTEPTKKPTVMVVG